MAKKKTEAPVTAPKPKPRKVTIKDLSDKDLKEASGGEFIPVNSAQE